MSVEEPVVSEVIDIHGSLSPCQSLTPNQDTDHGAARAAGPADSATNTSSQQDSLHVACTGEDVSSIPPRLWRDYGSTAIRLDLSYNKLETLSGVEHFKKLEELVLDNNELTDETFNLPYLPNLHTLTFNKNHIEDTDTLLSMLTRNCPHLQYLSLLGNRACPNELLQSGHDEDDYQKYRYYVLHKLPKLVFLDSRQVTNTERKEAKRVGAFMKVVRPPDDLFNEAKKKKKKNKESTDGPIPEGFNPLPEGKDITGQHRGVFGQCKYVYYGKHSEGNRFIRNQHL